MVVFHEMKEFKEVLVSKINADFSKVPVADIPYQFYADWFELVLKITKTVHPQFNIPKFPESITFQKDKDEINPVTDIYYFIDTNQFNLNGTDGYKMRIKSYDGFQQFDGNNYIEINPSGFPLDLSNPVYVSSHIRLDSSDSLATFFVEASPNILVEVEKILTKHGKEYL